jgi:HEAT repeat protein
VPLEDLVSRVRQDRVLAAEALGECSGPEVVSALCAALRDREPEVRIAVAKALGQVGDPAAITPLADALRACYTHRSALLTLVTGILAALGALAWAVVALVGVFVSEGSLLSAGDLLLAPFAFFANRRKRSRIAEAIANALARIAERHPTPELRNVLDELKIASLDVVSHGRTTRRATRAAAARIQELTYRIRALPLASQAPTPDPASLPLPADRQAPDLGHEGEGARR